MEVLKKVLIKEVDGSKEGDKVFYLENLPKSLLYRKEKKQIIDYTDVQNRQRFVPDFVLNDRGQKVPTGAFTDALLPGIEMSQSDDGAYCFFTQYNEAKAALAAIDRYVQQSVPVYDRVATRVPYAMQPGTMTSGPIALSAIPVVTLPEPVSPPTEVVQVPTNDGLVQKKPKRALSEEHKAKLRIALKTARERKQTNQG